MGGEIRVKVTVDTDELRQWADRHADAGHHGVAHVLYLAANDGESLTEQAIREAKAEMLREVTRDPSLRNAGHSGIGVRRLLARADQIEGRL